MKLNQDSLVTILICTDIGLSREMKEKYKPYTLPQWNKLADRILNSGLRKPSSLLNTERRKLMDELKLSDMESDRLEFLLSRGANIAIEMEQLESKGIKITTRADEDYPQRLKRILKKYSPAVLYYSGNLKLADNAAVAVVGSRDVDEEGMEFTKRLAKKAAGVGLSVVSGGAKGVDSIAESVAIGEGGTVVSVVSDSMSRKIKEKGTRNAIMSGNLLVLSAVNPDARFSVYSAMDRNKYIYALSDYTVAVSSTSGKGGTWTGAVENMKKSWTPLFVRDGKNIPKGNIKLIELGAISLPYDVAVKDDIDLKVWFKENSTNQTKKEEYQQIDIDMFSYKKEENIIADSGFLKETNELNEKKAEEAESIFDFDVYPLILPYLKEVLAEPKNQEEISKLLKVNKSQVSQWINRAIEDDSIKKLTKPTRYVLNRSNT